MFRTLFRSYSKHWYSSQSFERKCRFFAEQICLQFYEAICSSQFPATFKFVNVTTVFKQGPRNLKDNYRPISILSIVSKIFEKLINGQIYNHFDNIFSKSQCGFRKGFSEQHCFLLMINKWKEAVDSSKVFDALLNDLFKTSDCICHALLVAKLHTYRLSLLALKMTQDYLLNRKQRTKIRSSYSTWENITSGVPQVSILGPPPCLRSFHVTYFWNMRILVSLTKQVINTLWDCKQYSRSNRESYQYY